MPPRSHVETGDPVSCEEFGYGLGRPDGILVLRYHAAAVLEFGETRQDFLHQFYWSPDGMLATRHGSGTGFIGPRDVFWAHRATTHEVRGGDHQTVYRVCLREIPPGLTGLRAGPASIDAPAAAAIRAIARKGYAEDAALAARARIMAGLHASPTPPASATGGTGRGFALAVARALSKDPADPTHIDEWAARLHISPKTLQRDFVREFGMPYARWRTRQRLRASRVLLETHPVTEVAHLVGYASSSAFISAFAKEYGHTPGRQAPRDQVRR